MTLNRDVMFSSGKDDWETPKDLFDKLNEEFGFTLDACATDENAKCSHYFTEDTDGLSQDWQGQTVYCNPPYSLSGGQDKWVKKVLGRISKTEHYGCSIVTSQNRHNSLS